MFFECECQIATPAPPFRPIHVDATNGSGEVSVAGKFNDMPQCTDLLGLIGVAIRSKPANATVCVAVHLPPAMREYPRRIGVGRALQSLAGTDSKAEFMQVIEQLG